MARMRSVHRFALLLPLLAACGEGPLDPGAYSLEGSWLGRSYPLELSLELEQDGDNNVTGTGRIRGLRERLVTQPDSADPTRLDTVSIDTVITGSVDFDVEGDWDHPAFELRFTSEGFSEATYDAAFTDPDSISGAVQGSGFANSTVVITRRDGGS